MLYNFDEIVERRNTDSIKYDFSERRGKPGGILPLWVADMDFRTPPFVIEELVKKSTHGIFGYSDTGNDYPIILQNWFKRHFDWEIESQWLIKTPGVVYAICAAIRALTGKNDAVLVQQPVYYPFSEAVSVNERKLIINQLAYRNGTYSIDFEDFEKKIISNNVKLFILCNPHNPVGRVWTEEELIRMGDICLANNVIIISDEIHADFIYPGHRHLVFASIKPEYSKITVTCTAPTKTFNLAGLQISNIIIADSNIRKKIKCEIAKSGYSQVNIMGIVACKAAYLFGDEWLAQLNSYLLENLNFISHFLKERIPRIKLINPEGTYLVWMDCKDLGMDDCQLDNLIVHKAGLWLDAGTMFGAGGEGFQRINIACPRVVLEKAFLQLEKALENKD